MLNISVIGSGSWGTAITAMLAEESNNIMLWSYSTDEYNDLCRYRENKAFLPGVLLPDNIAFTNDIAECTENVDLIITAVPSHAMRATAASMAPYIKDGQIIVNISKGIEANSLQTLSQVLTREIPNANIAVMSGPSHAEEVSKKLPTTNVVAAKDIKVGEFIQDIFMNPYFRVYINTDILGVELGGAIKNVIALCAGITDGLGYGDNTKAALMTRGIAEMQRLGIAMGAKRETFGGLTGIGDLIVTCTSIHSRNYRCGLLIGKGMSPDEAKAEVRMVVEGITAAKAGYELSALHNIEMPIIEQAYHILYEGKNPKEAAMELMKRNKKHESEQLM